MSGRATLLAPPAVANGKEVPVTEQNTTRERATKGGDGMDSDRSLTVGELLDAIAEATGLQRPSLELGFEAAEIYVSDACGRWAMLAETDVVNRQGEDAPFVFARNVAVDDYENGGPMVCVPRGTEAIGDLLFNAVWTWFEEGEGHAQMEAAR